jgi:hypothetical protein
VVAQDRVHQFRDTDWSRKGRQQGVRNPSTFEGCRQVLLFFFWNKELILFFSFTFVAISTSSRRKKMVVDNSREGQILAIEKTFDRFVSEEEFLAGLRHPTKPELKAVESIPVFPDFNIWGNAYTLVTFDVDPEMSNDRPSRVQEEGVSPRYFTFVGNTILCPKNRTSR